MRPDDTPSPHEHEAEEPVWDISREEFAPGSTDAAAEAFDRRTFLKLMGAGAALAAGAETLGGCTKPQPPEKIVPYVNAPEGVIPGVPAFYASAIPLDGWGHGAIVEQHEGRPTKIEGNPDHPSSLGGTNIFVQASVLQLYDPDRSRTVVKLGGADTWGNLLEELRGILADKDLRVRILTGTVTSHTLADQIAALQKALPNLRWHRHDGIGTDNRAAGLKQAAGRSDLTPVYDFTKARRVVSLDSHFLFDEPGSVRYAREFAQRRRIPFKKFGPLPTHHDPAEPVPRSVPGADDLLRLYVAESCVTFTGVMADHRLPMKAGDIPHLAAALARALQGRPATLGGDADAWVRAAAADLQKAGSASLVMAGETQPPEVHALAHALNARLQSAAVRYVERIDFSDPRHPDDSLASLADDMNKGDVDLLLILDANPVYTSLGDIDFGDVLQRYSKSGRLAVHLGLYNDETAGYCKWHVPLSHPLEAWGDCRGHDGTASIIQPLIEPLWASKSAIEFLAGIIGLAGGSASDLYANGYDLVRRYWLAQWQAAPGEKEMRWRKALRDGILPDSAAKEVPNLQNALRNNLAQTLAAIDRLPPAPPLEINFRTDPSIGDGSWANHPWLQELPKPINRITWDTLLLISPKTARDLHLDEAAQHKNREREPMARFSLNGYAQDAPLWVQPGQPDGAVTLYLGGGRWRGGHVQYNIGINVNPMRTRNNAWSAPISLALGPNRHSVACVQNTQVMADRDILHTTSVDELPKAHGLHAPDLYGMQTDTSGRKVHLTLYDEDRYTGYKWGMVIDLAACIGCNACVIACQAENNIPTVGREQVLRAREMQWMRIDAYYGEKDTLTADDLPPNPRILFQPMLCQHCEDAPCELVCPVGATTHSSEGINEMTYNRCVGTRYCSNNCPYKVRRFNFLQYNGHGDATEDMQKNPNVTVRSRGVMEKCTYCIQRINMARINGKRDWSRNDAAGKPTKMRRTPTDPWAPPVALPQLSFMTACQQGCPTEAIVFGDLNDIDNYATILKTQEPWAAVSFGVLTELNTQPRTSYLPRIENPNPDFHGSSSATQQGGSLR
ncbi:MAG TPA: 4Fe-4S dicluster domain-containing protein [Phycisphaerae bacterium]|nr:4Fe-4S dicluster domain-containing protein [Phycisphaerae bacterium]